MKRPNVVRLIVFTVCGLWFPWWQWQNCKSKQASGWSFDSKPILLWLQRDYEVTRNVIHCLLLSKLKLGLELKQKNPPKPQILNNSYPTFLEWKNAFFHDGGIWRKAEARFRVKTKVPPEVTNSEQFLPHISGAAEYIFFRDRVIREFVVARLKVCLFLVLTHNFEMRRPVIIWLQVCSNWGLWFPWWLWQNCESKQASGCGFRDGSGKIVSQN